MKKHLLVGTFALFSLATFAQVTDLGGPISWKGKIGKTVAVPVEIMPGFDLPAIQSEDLINDQRKDIPWRFGYKYDTQISLENNGIWTELPNGNRIWRVEIQCAGAMTINLALENVHIPDGAHIYLYDAAQTHAVGAYTSGNNHPSQELGTELVNADHIVVEYFEPKAVRGEGRFTINHVVHGYRSLNIVQKNLAKALNDSGDCNYDARCPLDPYVGGISAWDDQIRSVAMIVVGSSGVCTGALINNSCDNGTPYFLTANHCLGGGTGNWLFRFNWDVPEGNAGMSCATTANTPTTFNNASNYNQTTVNGATTLVSGGQADHALLLLDNLTLANATNWGLFYAGWNKNDAQNGVTAVTGIHHPSGDIKKICRALDGGSNNISHSTQGGASVWFIDSWDDGVTEPGSSGSPLFDQNGRIIGQLYGGAAACAGTNNNGSYDFYGRLGVSWGLGIGAYLDPTSCGGSNVTNNGWDPSAPTLPNDASIQSVTSPTGTYCTSTITPIVVLSNVGSNNLTSVTINYNIDGGTNNVYNWSGNLTTGGTTNVTLPSMTTTAGSHTFNASTSSPNGTTDSNNANNASLSSFSTTPTGQALTLTIETDCWGYETAWVIVNQGTTNVVRSGGNPIGIPPGGLQIAGPANPGAYASEAIIPDNFCLANGCYDFIIYDDYGDGITGGGCATVGDYLLVNGAGTTLAQLGSNPNFGNSELTTFCLNPPGANVNELNSADFFLYPNPSNGVFNIQMTYAPTSNLTIAVTDVAGRIIYASQETSNAFTINLNDAADGTYFLHIGTEGSRSTLPIVVKK